MFCCSEKRYNSFSFGRTHRCGQFEPVGRGRGRGLAKKWQMWPKLMNKMANYKLATLQFMQQKNKKQNTKPKPKPKHINNGRRLNVRTIYLIKCAKKKRKQITEKKEPKQRDNGAAGSGQRAALQSSKKAGHAASTGAPRLARTASVKARRNDESWRSWRKQAATARKARSWQRRWQRQRQKSLSKTRRFD